MTNQTSRKSHTRTHTVRGKTNRSPGKKAEAESKAVEESKEAIAPVVAEEVEEVSATESNVTKDDLKEGVKEIIDTLKEELAYDRLERVELFNESLKWSQPSLKDLLDEVINEESSLEDMEEELLGKFTPTKAERLLFPALNSVIHLPDGTLDIVSMTIENETVDEFKEKAAEREERRAVERKAAVLEYSAGTRRLMLATPQLSSAVGAGATMLLGLTAKKSLFGLVIVFNPALLSVAAGAIGISMGSSVIQLLTKNSPLHRDKLYGYDGPAEEFCRKEIDALYEKYKVAKEKKAEKEDLV